MIKYYFKYKNFCFSNQSFEELDFGIVMLIFLAQTFHRVPSHVHVQSPLRCQNRTFSLWLSPHICCFIVLHSSLRWQSALSVKDATNTMISTSLNDSLNIPVITYKGQDSSSTLMNKINFVLQWLNFWAKMESTISLLLSILILSVLHNVRQYSTNKSINIGAEVSII